jgi:hypothetical protein
MDKAQQAVDSVVGSVKNIAIGDKKQKPKKEKKDKSSADGGVDAVSYSSLY